MSTKGSREPRAFLTGRHCDSELMDDDIAEVAMCLVRNSKGTVVVTSRPYLILNGNDLRKEEWGEQNRNKDKVKSRMVVDYTSHASSVAADAFAYVYSVLLAHSGNFPSSLCELLVSFVFCLLAGGRWKGNGYIRRINDMTRI